MRKAGRQDWGKGRSWSLRPCNWGFSLSCEEDLGHPTAAGSSASVQSFLGARSVDSGARLPESKSHAIIYYLCDLIKLVNLSVPELSNCEMGMMIILYLSCGIILIIKWAYVSEDLSKF